MSKRFYESTSKYPCERYNRYTRLSQHMRGDKAIPRAKLVKKVVLSKNITPSASENRKSCSTGIINQGKTKSTLMNQQKSSKSDCVMDPVNTTTRKIDYCKQCGDVEITRKDRVEEQTNKKTSNILNLPSLQRLVHNSRTSKHNQKNGTVKQYYKNENFQTSSESIPDMTNKKKSSLDTIREQSENLLSDSKDTIFRIYPSSSAEELGFFNCNDTDNIEKIKEFRSENFFECHSVKSRIESDVAMNKKHKCIYRFYLNDRLFPVPFNADFNENIRCMECNLPLKNKEDFSNINGMIQAKVKINNKIQDTIVMLPVKEPLIIKERKKEIKTQKELDSVYFGIIKLNLNGDSVFNRTLPEDSLALKYQKGYKEFCDVMKCEYENCDNNDIIVI